MIDAAPQAPATPPAAPTQDASQARPVGGGEARGASDRAAFATTLLTALGLLAPPPSDSGSEAELATELLDDAELGDSPGELEAEALDAEVLVEDAETSASDASFAPLALTDVSEEAAVGATAARAGGVGDEGPRLQPAAPEVPASNVERNRAEPPPPAALPAATDPGATEEGSDRADGRGVDARADARGAAPATPQSNVAPSTSFEGALTRAESPESSGGAPRTGGADGAGRVLPELPVRNEASLLEQARLLISRNGGQARIELHPPQLGQLGLRIQVTHHAVQLDIVADKLPVAELLSRHLPDLQNALASQGLHIDRANVELRDRSADGRSPSSDSSFGEGGRGGGGRDDASSDAADQSPFQRRALPAYSLGAIDLHA